MGSRTPLQTHCRRERSGLAKQIKKVSDDGKKSLLEAIFSKKKSANGPPSSSPNRRAPAPTPDSAALARGVEILHTIFPKWESETLQVVLEANRFIMEDTIAAVLKMEQAEHAAVRAAKLKGAKNACENNRWPVKHPLPDDFLKLPDDDETVINVPSEEGIAEEEDEECGESEKEEEGELEDKGGLEASDAVNDSRSDRSSSTLAEDDGTLYGKEFDDDRASTDGVIAPVFDDATMRANQKIVADAMNQKFLPVELRNKRPSIFDTAHIDVIKKSKLNLFEAEERIRHREPHLVFGLLSKASEIYRSGVISSHELDCLRSMILSRIQPTKMLMDMTMKMNSMMSDHEWHLLILKAKGIRHALCIRISREESEPARNSGHMEYIVRVVDVESGVVWFTRKRFRELYKLHRKLSRLSGQVNECVFPTRRAHGRNSPNQLAYDRAPVLENFLRTTAALVAPSPLTFLHGVALKQLQQFLEVPHVGILERNRTQPISRELRVFVYHTVNDRTSPEGKACQKFLSKMKQSGFKTGKNVLDEIGDILDGVQEYMLEHRFEEMRLIVQRLMKQILSGNAGSPALGRHSSFVSLMTTDTVSNQDKLHQLVSDAIRHELEDRICVPLMYDLTQYLRRHVRHEEHQFRQRVLLLKGKPQSYFGIPVDKISLSSWRSVVDIVKEVDRAFLPLDKMRKLVSTAHQIHVLYKTEHTMRACASPRHRRRNSTPTAGALWQPQSSPLPMTRVLSPSSSSSNRSCRGLTIGDEAETFVEKYSSGEEPKEGEEEEADGVDSESSFKSQEEDVLSGDDFLPIFIYVIVHSDLEAPIFTQVLLNRLCDFEKRRSESGYYLATFEAALHHILSLELPGIKAAAGL
uniref:VPS9 domain-containing protein n=1 Tax=Peronospora matthiolae TaxID=2874970 RepID=A0AAV1V3V8_9STRA